MLLVNGIFIWFMNNDLHTCLTRSNIYFEQKVALYSLIYLYRYGFQSRREISVKHIKMDRYMHTKIAVVYDTHFASSLLIIKSSINVSSSTQIGEHTRHCVLSASVRHIRLSFISFPHVAFNPRLSSDRVLNGTTDLKPYRDIDVKYRKISIYHNSHHMIPLASSIVIFSKRQTLFFCKSSNETVSLHPPTSSSQRTKIYGINELATLPRLTCDNFKKCLRIMNLVPIDVTTRLPSTKQVLPNNVSIRRLPKY